MAFQFPPIAFLTVLSVPLWIGLIVIVARKQNAPGATPLLFILTGALFWTGANTLHVLYIPLDLKVFWANCQYFGIIVLPAAWFVFALEYTGYEKYITKESILFLTIEPLVVLFAVWTNPIHEWFRTDTTIQTVNGYVYLLETFGIAFWVHTIYSYCLLGAGTILILYAIYQTQSIYRHQAIAVSCAVIIPWGANILELVTHAPFSNTFPPIALIGTGALFTYAVVEYELLDSHPIPRTLTRETLIGTMDEAAIVIDSQQRIIDFNHAGERLLNQYQSTPIGNPIKIVIPEIASKLFDTDTRMSFHQLTLTIENKIRYYDLQILKLVRETNVVAGHILILRDITERERHQQRLEVMNRILRHDLRNQMNILLAHVEELKTNPEAVQSKADALLEKGQEIIALSDRARELELTLSDTDNNIEPLEVTEIIRTHVSELTQDYPHATVTIDAPSTLTVTASPLLDTAIDNLLNNAIEHNDSPNPEIHLTIEEPTTPSDDARIQISDNGPGIPEQEQTVIERGRETPLDHSSGLGLWIVHWIITESGGEITFEENYPKGTIVTIRLPVPEPH